MDADELDPTYALDLLRRQDALQAEAGRVVVDLDLLALLAGAGRVEQVGSSVSGLMVWRDLDFNVLCRDLSSRRAFESMRPLLAHPGVARVDYRSETGHRAPAELRGDERYYFVTYLEVAAGATWKIDVSFWLSDAPRDQVPYIERLREQLTDETRLAILWIKDVWWRLPTYPDEVGGFDVYEAVLRHGVRTPGQFDTYLRARGLPGRADTADAGRASTGDAGR
ncbi:MAG: hypothetical protein AVDCRST_MAG49-4075 [uncultured Thermomicrobiales bacterium]|uniref:Polymerase nucleotidyl transferase domain-containing protein n=1 Tax=uncultured Thermomicrobiales bacterium TaxID=1645740 RepID=A0A6J4VGH3_9BACT|nr:MAG: hypothetical protein AVDCRST_MAG49-4075 [uncultured Thermomicrobiales bacterium]